jgi:hypothetical protein
MRRFGRFQGRSPQTFDRVQNQHFDARVSRDGKMVCAFYHDIGNNLRMARIFRS